MDAIIGIPDLRDRKVWFTPTDGPRVQTVVEYVWPGMGAVPGVNLRRVDTGEKHTSVPHVSAVNGASSFFWSWGFGEDETALAE